MTTESSETVPKSRELKASADPRLRRRTIWRWLKRAVGVLFVLAVVGVFVLALMPHPVPVELAPVERGMLRVTVDEDGRTRVKDRYVVSAPLTGNLARIELKAGDDVEAGAVLARLVPLEAPLLDERSRRTTEAQVSAAGAATRQAQAQITRAEAAVAFAEKRAAEERGLRRDGTNTQFDLDRAELELKTARADLESARFAQRVASHELSMANAALGRMQSDEPSESLEVPCPIDGRVLQVIHESEGAVQAATPLLELGDPKALEIAVDVLTSDAVEIQPGAQVAIERWGGDPLKGRVRLVEPSAFTKVSSLGVEEQRVNVVIDLDVPYEQWKRLGDGYRVEARIVVWQGENVLSVPTSAVFRSGEGWAAYVVRDGVARLQVVRIGRRTGARVQILEGLAEGAEVVTHPSDRIQDGVEVEPR